MISDVKQIYFEEEKNKIIAIKPILKDKFKIKEIDIFGSSVREEVPQIY